MSCDVGHRHGSDLALLWFWHKLAATAPIRTLAWEPAYAEGAALEKAKRQKKKERNELTFIGYLLMLGFLESISFILHNTEETNSEC